MRRDESKYVAKFDCVGSCNGVVDFAKSLGALCRLKPILQSLLAPVGSLRADDVCNFIAMQMLMEMEWSTF